MLNVISSFLLNGLNSSLLFYIQLGTLFCILFSANSFGHPDYFLICLHLLIGFVSLWLIVRKSFGLLANTLGIYTLVGFCFSPILELLTGTVYWDGSALSFSSQLMGIIWTVIFLLLFILGYHQKLNFPSCISMSKTVKSLRMRETYPLVVISIILFLFLISLYDWNFTTLFFRGGEFSSDLQVDTKSSFLIVEFFLRPLIFNIGLFLFFFRRQSNFLWIVSLFAGILAAFPTGIPRFLATSLYIPFCLNWAVSYISDSGIRLQKLNFFLSNILLFGLVFVFPFLDVFRFYTSSKINSFAILNFDTFLSGHFDGFQMLVRALDVGSINFGFGFFGAILFFVPRSFWPEKPISSAPEIAALSNLSFDNLSMPLIAEFYLNYWYVGIIVGGFLLGVIFGAVDRFFQHTAFRPVTIPLLFFFESIGLVLLILRGSFLSAFAYFVAVALTWIFIWLAYLFFHALKPSPAI